jgi:hypothetical protein
MSKLSSALSNLVCRLRNPTPIPTSSAGNQYIKVCLDHQSVFIDYGDRRTGSKFSRIEGRVTIDITQGGLNVTYTPIKSFAK